MTNPMNNKIYKAALYCRLSKDDDDRDGDSSSIKTQKALLERYCKDHNYLIYDYYVDDGYSGLNFDRPDFKRLLSDIDNGSINMVITKDLSRLGRDYIQTGYYSEIYFDKRHVRYIAVNDAYDSNQDDNDFAPFRHILNDMYAKDLSRKVKSAKRQRALNGLFISSQAPYGYIPCPENHNHLIIDEPAAEVVRYIFSLALSDFSAKKIANLLTADSVHTPGFYKYQHGDTRFKRYIKDNPSRWCDKTVHAILKDQVYTGNLVSHKVEISNYKTKQRIKLPITEHIIVKNTHAPIVSYENWQTVQQLMYSRYKAPHHNFVNIFRGILFCSDCGCRLSMGTKNKKGKYYHHYRCNNHYRNPSQCSHSHQISFSELNHSISEQIEQLIHAAQNDSDFYSLLHIHNDSFLSPDSLTKETNNLEKQLNELSYRVRKLFDDHACGIIDTKNYEMIMKDIQSQQSSVEQKQSLLQLKLSSQNNFDLQREQFREMVKNCNYAKELTSSILHMLIERIEVGHLEKFDNQKHQDILVVWKINSH